MISKNTCQNCKYTTEIPSPFCSPYFIVNYCGFCGLKFTKEPKPGLYERVENLESRMKTWIEFDYHKLEGRGAKLEERIEKLERLPNTLMEPPLHELRERIEKLESVQEVENTTFGKGSLLQDRIEKIEEDNAEAKESNIQYITNTNLAKNILLIQERLEKIEVAWQREPNYIDYKTLQKRMEKIEGDVKERHFNLYERLGRLERDMQEIHDNTKDYIS